MRSELEELKNKKEEQLKEVKSKMTALEETSQIKKF
jgi:hypothetical protein